MADAYSRVKRSKFSKKNRINIRTIPTKRVINFAEVNDEKINIPFALAGIALILFLAALFGKFAVYDRIVKLDQLQREVNEMQVLLEKNYAELEDYPDVAENYAHYTYSEMTQEEIARVNRADVIKMIRNSVLPYAEVESWSIIGNELTIPVTAGTLEDINSIVRRIEKNEMVVYCTVSTAATDNIANTRSVENYENVTGHLIVVLQQPVSQ